MNEQDHMDENDSFQDEGNGYDNDGFSSSSLQDSSFNPEKSGTLEIAGSKLVYGVHWESQVLFSEEDSKKNVVKDARNSAHEQGADLYCVPNKTEAFWGVASTEQGIKPGMKPLAAVVARSITQRPFFGIFEVSSLNAYYVIGLARMEVSNQQNRFRVMEDTDILVSDTDTDYLEDLFQTISATHFHEGFEDGQLVMPETLPFREAVASSTNLKDIIPEGIKTPTKFSEVSQRKLFLLAGVSALAITAILGGIYYEHHAEELKKQATLIKLQKTQAQFRLQTQRRIKSQVTDKFYDYDNKPVGLYALSECEELVKHISFEAPGWNGDIATCNPQSGTVTATYSRTHGDQDWLETWMQNKSTFPTRPTVSFTGGGNSATVTWKTPGFFSHRYGKHEQSGHIQPEYNYLKKTFSHYGMPVDMSIFYAPRPQPIQGAPPDLKIPVFDSMKIHFTTYYNPTDFIPVFAPISKLVLDSMTISLKDPTQREQGHKWTVNMTSYQLRMESAPVNRNLVGRVH